MISTSRKPHPLSLGPTFVVSQADCSRGITNESFHDFVKLFIWALKALDSWNFDISADSLRSKKQHL